MRSYTAEELEACCLSFELNSEAVQQDFVVDSRKRQRTSIELKPGGSDIDVTLDNLETYVVAVCQTLVNDTLSKVVPVVLEGIAQGMNTRALEHFNAAELDLLLCGSPARWTRQDLEDFLDYDHGYTASSRPCIILREVLAEMTSQEQEKFLKWT